MRDGKAYVATLELEAAPETVPRDELEIAGVSPLTGARVFNLSPAVAEELAYDGDPNGVIVHRVVAGSAADTAGLARGDVVLEVNGVDIDTTRRLAEVCSEPLRVWHVAIERDGRIIRTQFRS
ncbi:MAG: PDZ domain-containing protein [Hyphomicrobiales bacterium]|nr:PDZ domain-containing protein [Hyphomicrobiales bacterium]